MLAFYAEGMKDQEKSVKQNMDPWRIKMTRFLNRESSHAIEPLFLSRVSYRAFSTEPLEEEELLALFEAARWSPSAYNHQPWRFVYSRRGDATWSLFFDALVEFNKSWCRQADTLVVVISKNIFEFNGKAAATSRFDTGAAWMSLALEAHARHLIAHGMQGFDYAKIKQDLGIPDHFTVEAMIAIGKPGRLEELPPELQAKETPSLRKPLEEIIARGHCTFT